MLSGLACFVWLCKERTGLSFKSSGVMGGEGKGEGSDELVLFELIVILREECHHTGNENSVNFPGEGIKPDEVKVDDVIIHKSKRWIIEKAARGKMRRGGKSGWRRRVSECKREHTRQGKRWHNRTSRSLR